MKFKLIPTFIFCLTFTTFLSSQTIQEQWSVNAMNTFVLIGSENMDDDPQKELVYLQHLTAAPNQNPRIVIFDGLNGGIDYDSGTGIGNHFNVAGYNWTTDSGANINTGTNALHDIDNDGIFELIYNRNGQTNEVIGFNGSSISVLLTVNSLNSFVLIGVENMDGDNQKELVFLEHRTASPSHNPRIVIFDGLYGTVDYDSGSGMGNHFNIAGFNWTTDSGANINTGTKALHDIDNDGKYELIYNRNGQTNEVIGFDGSSIKVILTVNSMNTYVLIGVENMDNDVQKELVFLEHQTYSPSHNPRIIIFDSSNGGVEYDSGIAPGNHFNIAGFNWTPDSGANINTGTKALHDIDNDGIYELVYNRNGQTNEVIGFDGSSITVILAVNSMNTYVLIGVENMDGDTQKEMVFLEHHTYSPVQNPRIVIFDGLYGNIDYDSGAAPGNHFNVPGFNWTTDSGANINTGTKALHDIDNDGIYELVYNRNGQTNEVIGYNNSIAVLLSVNSLNTFVLTGVKNMDNDTQKELVFLEHQTASPSHNPRIVIFDGLHGTIDYDSGPGLGNHFNVAGFNWTTDSGANINTGAEALHDIDGNGIFEMTFNQNGAQNVLIGLDFASPISEINNYSNFDATIYPNPVSTSLNLKWQIENTTLLQIEIWDNQGRRLAVLFNTQCQQGEYQDSWNITDWNLAPGYYLCVFNAGSKSLTCPFVVDR
jgi:ribosomal protein L21E